MPHSTPSLQAPAPPGYQEKHHLMPVQPEATATPLANDTAPLIEDITTKPTGDEPKMQTTPVCQSKWAHQPRRTLSPVMKGQQHEYSEQ